MTFSSSKSHSSTTSMIFSFPLFCSVFVYIRYPLPWFSSFAAFAVLLRALHKLAGRFPCTQYNSFSVYILFKIGFHTPLAFNCNCKCHCHCHCYCHSHCHSHCWQLQLQLAIDTVGYAPPPLPQPPFGLVNKGICLKLRTQRELN